MAGPLYYPLVRDTSGTTGTGALALSGISSTGFLSTFSVVGNGNTCYYRAISEDRKQIEIGLATISNGGLTLTRSDVSYSSNGNNAVNFTSTPITVDLIASEQFYRHPGVAAQTAFSEVIPLNGVFYMPLTTITAPVAFTQGSAMPGGVCFLSVIADGVNFPIFSGFSEAGTSSGYNNTAGVENSIIFWNDGVRSWYSAFQLVNAVPVAIPFYASSFINQQTETTLTILFSANIYSVTPPDTSAFTVAASGGAVTVTNVILTSGSAILTLSRSIDVVHETGVTISYTKPAIHQIQDATQTYDAPSFNTQPVTLNAIPSVIWDSNQMGIRGALSNQGQTATGNSAAPFCIFRANSSKSTGKFYFELKILTYGFAGGVFIGLADDTTPGGSGLDINGAAPNMGAVRSDAYAGDISGTFALNGSLPSITMGVGVILGVAADLDNKKAWVSSGGTWVTGDPVAGTNPTITWASAYALFPMAQLLSSSVTLKATPATITNSPPTGYQTWGT